MCLARLEMVWGRRYRYGAVLRPKLGPFSASMKTRNARAVWLHPGLAGVTSPAAVCPLPRSNNCGDRCAVLPNFGPPRGTTTWQKGILLPKPRSKASTKDGSTPVRAWYGKRGELNSSSAVLFAVQIGLDRQGCGSRPEKCNSKPPEGGKTSAVGRSNGAIISCSEVREVSYRPLCNLSGVAGGGRRGRSEGRVQGIRDWKCGEKAANWGGFLHFWPSAEPHPRGRRPGDHQLEAAWAACAGLRFAVKQSRITYSAASCPPAIW